MTFPKPITFPIFHINGYVSKFKGCDIEYEYEDCDIRPITFFTIDGVSPHKDNGKWYSEIHANGSHYISPLTYEEVLMMLDGIELNLINKEYLDKIINYKEYASD